MLDPAVLSPVMAIFGLAVGYCFGLKIRSFEPTAPGWCAVGGAVLFVILAGYILAALAIAALVFGLWKGRHLLREMVIHFSEASGLAVRSVLDLRTHESKRRRIDRKHRKRLESIYRADIPPDKLGVMVEKEDNRYYDEMEDLHCHDDRYQP
jgi:hypothetical protein